MACFYSYNIAHNYFPEPRPKDERLVRFNGMFLKLQYGAQLLPGTPAEGRASRALQWHVSEVTIWRTGLQEKLSARI